MLIGEHPLLKIVVEDAIFEENMKKCGEGAFCLYIKHGQIMRISFRKLFQLEVR